MKSHSAMHFIMQQWLEVIFCIFGLIWNTNLSYAFFHFLGLGLISCVLLVLWPFFKPMLWAFLFGVRHNIIFSSDIVYNIIYHMYIIHTHVCMYCIVLYSILYCMGVCKDTGWIGKNKSTRYFWMNYYFLWFLILKYMLICIVYSHHVYPNQSKELQETAKMLKINFWDSFITSKSHLHHK